MKLNKTTDKKQYIYHSDKEFLSEETTKPSDVKDVKSDELDRKYSEYINEGD